MAKIRAYKLAEELGIDRNEFVEKANEAGYELKNAMAALEPETVEALRQRLGGEQRKAVVEERVERKGTAVIRRRRKRAPEPAEEPAPAEPAAEEAPAAEVAGTSAPAADEPEEERAPAAEEAMPEPVPEPVTEEQPAAEAGPDQAAAQAPSGPARRPSRPAEPSAPERKSARRKRVREVVNLREQERFARQVTGRSTPRRVQTIDPRALQSPRRRRRDAPSRPAARGTAPPKEEKRVVRVEGEIQVGELAKQMGVKAPQVQAKLMALGTMVSVNSPVDVETARQVAGEFGFEVSDVGFKEEEFIETAPPEEAVEDPSKLELRAPVITVMGHVDHGKTSLLDTLRKANVVSGEAGGITQHIGAYQARTGDHLLTFIDTPGHAAFTAMRARGAQVTDIVVLVVAADDGVMPQTVEAIEHARAAGVPIVVAVNKCDLPDANPQAARQRLMEHGLVAEDFGGDTICVDVSAVKGTGLDQLLEMLALQAELLELKADPAKRGRGVVLEAELDKGRGPVATILVQDGTLRRGDIVVCGTHWGRVRQMENDRGERVKEAGPSTPVRIMGLSGVPEAGQDLHAVENERVAKQIVGHREDQARKEAGEPPKARLTLEEIFAQAEGEGPKELPVVLKADVHGTSEAVRDALEKLSTEKVKLNVLSTGVGAISENDVMLASASGAIVVGFHVRPDPAARKAADSHGVDVRVYQIIMDLLDDVKGAMAGLLPPTTQEVLLGRAEVRDTFTIPRVGTIAGCFVTEGLVRRNASCRLVRDGVQIYQGKVGSLKRFKDDAREVQTGYECGLGIEGYNDVKVGDAIEVFELEEKPATL